MKTNPFGSGKKDDVGTVEGPEAVTKFFQSIAKDARRLPRPPKKATSRG